MTQTGSNVLFKKGDVVTNRPGTTTYEITHVISEHVARAKVLHRKNGCNIGGFTTILLTTMRLKEKTYVDTEWI